MPRKNQTTELTSKILNLHRGGMYSHDIANSLSIPYKKVNQALSNNGKLANKGWVKEKKQKFNESYFNTIDNHRKAYFFGLIYSDGSVYPKQNRISIQLKNDDSYLIEELKKEIDANVPLSKSINKAGTTMKSMQLYSEKMCTDLIKHGCIHRKSLIKKFPNIDEDYLFSFLRGYFDGNGCVFLHKVKQFEYLNIQISSSLLFNEMLKFILSGYGIKVSIHVKEGNCSDLKVSRQGSIRFIRDKMYKNDSISMVRKKQKLYAYNG